MSTARAAELARIAVTKARSAALTRTPYGGGGAAEDYMNDLSFLLSRAVDKGRAGRGVPKSRQTILRGLLNKRAEAHRQGLRDQERMLREQIRWALPVNEPVDD